MKARPRFACFAAPQSQRKLTNAGHEAMLAREAAITEMFRVPPKDPRSVTLPSSTYNLADLNLIAHFALCYTKRAPFE